MTKYDRYLKALNQEFLYGIKGVTWLDGYVVKDGIKIEHVSEDFLLSQEGENFINNLAA